MPRQVLTVEDSSDALDRQPPVDRLGNQPIQSAKNAIWNFIARLTAVFRVTIPLIEEDSLFSESTPPTPPPPWHSGDSVRSMLAVLWQHIDQIDFRIRYAFGLLESNLRALTQRINLTANWLMRLSKRVGRAEELILLLDRSLTLLESQMHRLLFQSPKGGAAPKPRPGSGKSASSSQKRPLGRFSRLQKIATKKAAKRKSAGNGEQIQDKLLQMESEIDKMAERISRLQKQMRNVEKSLRQHHLIDGALSESEPSEMD